MTEPNDDRVLFLLKTKGPRTAAALGKTLGMTAVGARQHLLKLAARGLVAFEDRREAVGRPKRYWRLTAEGHGRFPDSHANLAVELIDAVRAQFGDDGLDRLISQREGDTLAAYSAALAGCDDLGAKVRKLAELREQEGYMAECRDDAGGGYLLIENHCPICAAASVCLGFCRSEIDIFRQALGGGVAVERVEHLLAGGRRCTYRIVPAEV